MTGSDHARALPGVRRSGRAGSSTLEVRPLGAEEFREHLVLSSDVSYQQTPEWAEVRRDQWHPELLGWFDAAGTRVGVAVVRYRVFPGIGQRLAFIPHGPLLDWAQVDVTAAMDALRLHLSSRRVFAVRISPWLSRRHWGAESVRRALADPALHRISDLEPDVVDPVTERVEAALRAQGWRPQQDDDSLESSQPRFAARLPLAGRSEEAVLAAMSKSWRRSIKRSSREGVEIRRARREDLPTVHRLHVETAQRAGFPVSPLSFFEAFWDQFGAERSGLFYLDLGCHDGEVLSADSVVQIGGAAHGVFGTNSLRRPEVKMSNAMYWAQIRRAIADGAHLYDTGGVTPVLDEDHPQGGLLRFKAGLGGEVVEHIGTWDLAIRPTVYSAFTTLQPLYSSVVSGVTSRLRRREPSDLRSY